MESSMELYILKSSAVDASGLFIKGCVKTEI